MNVDGIRCNHCEGNIKLTLREIKGVKNIKIRKKKQVTIELSPNSKVPQHQLVAAIENAGYKVATSSKI